MKDSSGKPPIALTTYDPWRGWPDLDPLVGLQLAWDLEGGTAPAAVWGFLGFAPWRSKPAFQDWIAAVKAGAVLDPGGYLIGYPHPKPSQSLASRCSPQGGPRTGTSSW